MRKLRYKPGTVCRYLESLGFVDVSHEFEGSHNWIVWRHPTASVEVGLQVHPDPDHPKPFWVWGRNEDHRAGRGATRFRTFRELKAGIVTLLLTR